MQYKANVATTVNKNFYNFEKKRFKKKNLSAILHFGCQAELTTYRTNVCSTSGVQKITFAFENKAIFSKTISQRFYFSDTP
jgi:hypothetical protein